MLAVANAIAKKAPLIASILPKNSSNPLTEKSPIKPFIPLDAAYPIEAIPLPTMPAIIPLSAKSLFFSAHGRGSFRSSA
jgi:hypothetical protein